MLISGFKHATISIRGYFKFLSLPIFRSPCERPRTYDKFYQRNPGNFQPGEQERDSAISVCSSEECDQVTINDDIDNDDIADDDDALSAHTGHCKDLLHQGGRPEEAETTSKESERAESSKPDSDGERCETP